MLIPPLVTNAVALARDGSVPKIRRYQGVTTIHDMTALHTGGFAIAFDRANLSDPHLGPDLVRLRTYNLWFFAESVKRLHGDFLSVGISYGVASKVLHDLVVSSTPSRTHHFVDPFTGIDATGTQRPSYNTSIERVRNQYTDTANICIHRAAIPTCLPLPGLDAIAFTHLATGVPAAEAQSLPHLYDRTTPGGVIVIDSYAFHRGHRHHYDPVAARLGTEIFTLPTGQGILRKPA